MVQSVCLGTHVPRGYSPYPGMLCLRVLAEAPHGNVFSLCFSLAGLKVVQVRLQITKAQLMRGGGTPCMKGDGG